MHPTAITCTAILGILLFGLGLSVSMLRFREKRLAGHEGDPTNLLHRVVRAHGNTAEYAPFLAVLFLYLGGRNPGAMALGLMVAATACRVLLAVGLIAWPTLARPNPVRFVGALGTYLAGLALCVTLLRTA